MKPLSFVPLLLAAASVGAIATAAAAQEHTTVIREHHEVVSTPAPQTTETQQVVQTRSVVRHTTARRHAIVHRAVRHRAKARTVRAAHYDSRTAVTSVTEPAGPPEVTSYDRKTVIHRDEDGVVHRRTRVVRTNPDGSKDVTVRHNSDDAPPPPPRDDPDPR